VETLDLTQEQLEVLRRERALRDPASWPRGRPPTMLEAAMDEARDAQGSGDPNKARQPEGVCVNPLLVLRLLQRALDR
jgi:hypothetical protein